MHYCVSSEDTVWTVSHNVPCGISISQMSQETNSTFAVFRKETLFNSVDSVKGTHQEEYESIGPGEEAITRTQFCSSCSKGLQETTCGLQWRVQVWFSKSENQDGPTNIKWTHIEDFVPFIHSWRNRWNGKAGSNSRTYFIQSVKEILKWIL